MQGFREHFVTQYLRALPITNMNNFQEPVVLIGEGEYNINVIKEIQATESFLELDEDIRKCQTKEPLSNCTTRQYIDTIVRKCGCLPFNIIQTHKVYYTALK